MDSGKDILGNSGGSTVVKNVLAYKPYVMRVYYNSTNQRCIAKLNGHELSGTNYGNYTDYSFSQIHENDEVDVQVTDKPCRITVSKSEVYANLMATRMIDGQSYATFLSNEMQLTAGYGTKFSFVVPNTVALQTAKLGNNSASVITDSNGNKTYSFTVPQSENAYLTLVGTPVTSPQSDYSLQTVTKVGHGTVRYSTWYYDEDYVNHQTAGELMTPVSTIITPLGESEGECGWTLTITPDPGYELTTLFGSWDTNGSENGYSRPDVVNMLTEHAYIDNDTEEEYPGMDGPTAEQKLASGGNFSLDLDVDRTLSYNASTRTYTFNVDGIDWDEQFESLNSVKDSLIEKGNSLLSDFNELVKQVKNNISDFEVSVPFDESIGEKFESKIEDGKLIIEVTFKDEHTERSNRTCVLIPQNCDIEKKSEKYNSLAKTMTVIIPKVISEPKEEAKDEKKKSARYKVSHAATPKKSAKKEEVNHAQEAASKLLRKFRENASKTTLNRAPNGRFVKRTPSE